MNTFDLALDILATTPIQLRSIITALPPGVLVVQPSPDAWSVEQVLRHLLQVENAVIAERIRRMVREENPTFTSGPSVSVPSEPAAILNAWLAAREDSLAMLRALTPAQLARSGQHPRYGPITVREHVVEWAYHDLDHLRQILAALQSVLYPEIGAFQTLYSKPS